MVVHSQGRILFEYHSIMKNQFRTKKVVLDQAAINNLGNKNESRGNDNGIRFHPNRVLIRAHPKQEQKPRVVESVNAVVNNFASQEQLIQYRQQQANYQTEYIQGQTYDARDRKTIVRFQLRQGKFNLQAQKQRFNQWLGDMHFKVASASFNLFLTKALSFQQSKVHCCENLLLNILIFLEKITQTNNQNSQIRSTNNDRTITIGEMAIIMKHINDTLLKNLQYLMVKYPLTKDSKPNKALQALTFKINNTGSDDFDLIGKSPVQFRLKQDQNYMSQIMRFLNHLISQQNQLSGVYSKQTKKQLNYFQFFYQTMQKIFTSVYKPEEDLTKKQEKAKKAQADPSVMMFAKIMTQHSIEDQVPQGQTKQQKQYKEKVMKYTHYLIGRKLSSNIEPYSQKDIENQIFDVKNSSILRILTKWASELQSKIMKSQQEILKRPFRFKKTRKEHDIKAHQAHQNLKKKQKERKQMEKQKQKQKEKTGQQPKDEKVQVKPKKQKEIPTVQFAKLSANQKNDLFQQAKNRAQQIKKFDLELKGRCNQIESMLSFYLKQQTAIQNIPKSQYKVGYFCSKIQSAASSTLISYLNKIIHMLLKIPDVVRKAHSMDQQYNQNMDINLVTFKISDLFRCKIKSRQAQIVRIFNQIKQISQKQQPFKIIRIKNRLNLGTRDIMVNILLMNKFLCEIQLAVQQYQDQKQKNYDSFSHFIYQLHRSRLGPIMQSACTWAQFDQRVKIFSKINTDKSSLNRLVPHACGDDRLEVNYYPFVCTSCQRFYSSQEGLVKHVSCTKCKAYYQCSQCRYKKMSKQQISKMVGFQEKVGQLFAKQFELWYYQVNNKKMDFPKAGLLTSRYSKKTNFIFFQKVLFKNDAYIINIVENRQSNQNADLVVIEKVINNSSKQWKNISEKYIVYQWNQNRLTSDRLTPDSMTQAMQAQKKRIKDEEQKKRIQNQQKRKKLDEKKRKQQQQYAQKYFTWAKTDGQQDDFVKKQKQQKKRQRQDKKQKQLQQQRLAQQKRQQRKKQQLDQKRRAAKYYEKLFPRSQHVKVRAINIQQQARHILVLGIYLKQSVIRNKLKTLSNQDIITTLNAKKMQVLFLEDSYIKDQLADLQALTQSEMLEFKQSLDRVSQIYLNDNYIQNIRFLQYMPNLKVVHLSNNSLYDLQAFQNLKNLNEIQVSANEIGSLQGLYDSKELLQLNLSQNQIQNIEFFSLSPIPNDFAQLRNLSIADNNITSMLGLDKLVSLVKLDLSFNDITQIIPYQSLTNLSQLDLDNNQIHELKGLQAYYNLKRLQLSHNHITKMSSQLTKLNKLTFLDLSKNHIKHIQNLNNGPLKQTLKVLKLNNNKIKKIDGCVRLANLQVLQLSFNQITVLNIYLQLDKLQKLDLSHNSIESLDDIQQIKQELPNLVTLLLNANLIEDNPKNKQQEKTILRQYSLNGVNDSLIFKSGNSVKNQFLLCQI